jgi:hypothetical protein
MLRCFWPDIIHPGMINKKQDNLTMIQIPVDLAKLYTSFEPKLND